MKFSLDASNRTGNYVSGRWSIVNTRRNYWELRLDGIKVMSYVTYAGAKIGAAEYAAKGMGA